MKDAIPNKPRQLIKIAKAAKKAFHADGVRVFKFNEPAAGQTVFHLHFHVVPMKQGVEMRLHAQKMEDGGTLAHNAEMIREALKYVS